MAENTNISPEMISNLVNMLKNNSANGENSESEHTEGTSDAKKDINISDILSKFSTSSSTNSSSADSFSDSSSIDFDTIIKIKSIIESMNNKNDPNSNLLYSLKPYLRKSKQAKLDQYVNLLKISQVVNLLKNEKEGDAK